MKPFICLISAVLGVVLVNAAQNPYLFRAYPSNDSDDYKTEQEIKAELGSKKLEPEQTLYLISSYGNNLQGKLFGDWDASDFEYVSMIHPESCSDDYTLKRYEWNCKTLDEEGDGSVMFDNLSRYCHGALRKVEEFCAGQKDKVGA